MPKSKPPSSTPAHFAPANKEGGRFGHPFGFLLIQLLICLRVFLPGDEAADVSTILRDSYANNHAMTPERFDVVLDVDVAYDFDIALDFNVALAFVGANNDTRRFAPPLLCPDDDGIPFAMPRQDSGVVQAVALRSSRRFLHGRSDCPCDAPSTATKTKTGLGCVGSVSSRRS